MLDRQTRDAIGATLRRLYEARPKGGIPADHWRPLLDLESRLDARRADPTGPSTIRSRSGDVVTP